MSETCQSYALLLQAFPIICILAFSRFALSRGLLWCVVAGVALYHTLNFTVPLVLGNVGYLAPQYFSTSMLVISALLLLVGLLHVRTLGLALLRLRYKPRWIDLPIALVVGQTIKNCLIEYYFTWTDGPVFFDAANYHVPRALMWSWHGGMAPYQAPVWQMLGHPFGGTASILSTVFYGCGWLGGGFTTEVISLGAAVAVALLGLSFGFSGRGSLLAAVAFISFPPIGMRLSDVSTDIAGTFPVIAAAALFRTAGSLKEASFLFIALVGLGTACKQYAGAVAIPIGLMLVIPHLKKIFLDWRVWLAGLAGTAVAVFFLFISLRPIYLAFGDLSGGGTAVGLTNFGHGYEAFRDALSYYFLTTLFDPFSFLLPEFDVWGFHVTRREVYDASFAPQLYKWFGHQSFGDFPDISQERNKTGLLSILFLPWLILGFERGRRLMALALFLLVCIFQYGPLATNHVGARFAIVPLAAFALLWGKRADTRPLLVSLCLIAALLADRDYLSRRGNGRQYVEELEQNRDLSPLVQNDPVLLLPASLSQDSFIAGRRAQVRFEYIVCPKDGDWVKALQQYKASYKWIVFSLKEERRVPGPTFDTTVGPACTHITLDEFRAWMTAAGWKKVKVMTRNDHELWTVQ